MVNGQLIRWRMRPINNLRLTANKIYSIIFRTEFAECGVGGGGAFTAG
jgi:hypothetical protein